MKHGELRSFTPITAKDLTVLTEKMARKSCVLDPIPSKILLECLADLLLPIINLINNSVETATVPTHLKCTALEPRLKKDNMNTDEYSSFRPISNLKFASKCLEKVVAIHLDDVLI